jgi:predicted phage terminase large subunit-like protein
VSQALTFDPVALLAEAEAELCERSLYDFAKTIVWRVLEPATRYVDGWHIGAICEHLEAVTAHQIPKLLITMPPRHMKSLCVSVSWPAWMWVRKAAAKFIFSSHNQENALRDSVKTRDVILSPLYQAYWGDRFRLKDDQNRKTRFENDKTGMRFATSVGGGIGEGGDYLVCDDPHRADEIWSDTAREGVIEWWGGTVNTRLNDPKKGGLVVVQQRLHEADLAGQLLESGEWEHLNLPAEYEPPESVYVTTIGWKDPRKKAGELLWPERFGRTELDRLKNGPPPDGLGTYGYAAQFQQRPSPAGGGMVQRHWWRFWVPIGSKDLGPVRVRMPDGLFAECVVAPLPNGRIEFQSWDMTFDGGPNADYVVGQVWGQVGADAFLIDQVRRRMTFPETQEAVRTLSTRYHNAAKKLVERSANGPAIISSLNKEVGGMVPVTVTESKEGRLAAVSPIIESGNVYLPHPAIAPWVWDFIEEFVGFPNAANDDQVDAASQALKHHREKQKVLTGGGMLSTGKEKSTWKRF